MIDRNRFLHKLNLYYHGGFYYAPEENNGLDGTRTTSGSYTYVYFNMLIKKAMFIKQVLWDVANASTYTLTIGGVSYGDVTVGGATLDVTWNIGKIFEPTNSMQFRLTRASSGTIRDASSSSYSGTYFNIPATSYYGGSGYSYGSCMRLVYKPLVFEFF